ncbi:hypothetical protein PRZ48_001753 [Zasmidium cellare]|uniref:S-adenosyl-L-methionine-dependent methyltransferase n=1 Tax=Zasmidium cellare TaxID=395010 RepID=A0ABR0F408_ZASCE|nr:hypothetical protein PRZ48_001753 [Zasmidium cellare]
MSAFTEANRKAFDDLSASYNTKPWQIKLANQVAEGLQSRKDWLGAQWLDPSDSKQDVRLLDYACGTGAITKALGPYVSTIRGIDISENMVQKYNETARSSGLSEEQAHAVVGDLCGETVTENLNGSEWYDFDIAVIGLGFHHMEHPSLAIKRLAERLKPSTGVLVIIDFLPFDVKKDHDASGEQGKFPEMKHTIKHNGFTGEQMRDLYLAAGFEDFEVVVLKEPAVMELKDGTVQRTLFFARGRRVKTVWQKLTGWVGEMQNWAASGSSMTRVDESRWDPGFSHGSSQKVWDISKMKEEEYTGMEQNAPKKSWNGF